MSAYRQRWQTKPQRFPKKIPARETYSPPPFIIDAHDEIDGYSGFILTNRFGNVCNPHTINRVIERMYKGYNKQETEQARAEGRQPMLIRHFSVHNLRHTFCTRFCENETNLKVIQDIMGHADITTTMNIYAEATKEKKQEAMANLNGKIKIM